MIDYREIECTAEDYERAINKIEDENVYFDFDELVDALTDAEVASLWSYGLSGNWDYSLVEEEPKWFIADIYLQETLSEMIMSGDCIGETNYFYYWESR